MTELLTNQILCAEAAAIHGATLEPGNKELYRALSDLNSAAVCLSGGGIRSAAFALGVIQALATHPRSASSGQSGLPVKRAEDSLLAKFHYLSTVSGGGYIGSWLSAWRMNETFSRIWAHLVMRPGGPDFEPHQIGWLRSFSNYLTPKVGMTSADTWTALALWIRNLLLNWLLILLPTCALILLFKIAGLASTWVILWNQKSGLALSWSGMEWSLFIKVILECTAAIAAVLCLVKSLVFTMRKRPSSRLADDRGPDQIEFLKGTTIWSLFFAFLLVHFLASDLVGKLLLKCDDGLSLGLLSVCDKILKQDYWNVARYGTATYLISGAVVGAMIYGASWFLAKPHAHSRLDLLMWTLSGLTHGALVAGGLYIYLIIPDEGIGGLPVYFLHLVFGVPWILTSQVLAEMLFVGLSSYESGSDADREWFARSAGWSLAVALTWLFVTFLVFFGAIATPLLGAEAKRLESLAPAIAGVSGIVAAMFGTSKSLPIKGRTEKFLPYVISLVLPFIAVIFFAALLIALSYALDELLFSAPLMPETPDLVNFDWGRTFLYLLLGFAIFAVGGGIASWTININRFSLHAMYRNRLVRAFLGASRDRKPDRFTGFDLEDNPQMNQLWPPIEPKTWAPFQIINISLNVVSSRRLAWQERKAVPFTVSPLHCGSSFVGYRESAEYGGAITLGTAMGISGAAASPNMGYHSSPAITFLMTMFNVRLGWWLGNPGSAGAKTYTKEGPDFAIQPLVQEALGLTTDDRAYVYLSDGGHFENLGLYEMVRRRCRYIIVSDAGCDPNFGLDDLANAVRKIAIDLGVDIRFRNLDLIKPRPPGGEDLGPGHLYHAIGEIDYQAADGAKHNGLILYIKAGYHGVESARVRGYAKANGDFPHQPTIDQWFTESQFESYRALGFELTDGILNDALRQPECVANPTMEQIFNALHRSAIGQSLSNQGIVAAPAEHSPSDEDFVSAAAPRIAGEGRHSQSKPPEGRPGGVQEPR